MPVRERRVEISDDVADVLRRSTCAGASLVLPPGLDRKLYERTNKVLELLGGKWNRKSQAHLFPRPIADVLAEALASGEVLDEKKTYQFFETPQRLAERMVFMARVRPEMTVLEPSAGKGAIVRELVKTRAQVCCIEVNPACHDELVRSALGTRGGVLIRDFMMSDTIPGWVDFDRVVMNPPFANGQDVDHVMKAWQHLKPGGRMVAIMSGGVTFRQDSRTRNFRDWMERVPFVESLEVLPSGTFDDTGVESMLVVMDKG